MLAAPLFDLNIAHTFYPDGRCDDFAIVPTPSTLARLRGSGMIHKTRGDGLRMFLQVEADRTPFIKVAAPVTLEFDMRLAGRSFPVFTDLQALAAEDAPVFSNAGLPDAATTDLALSSRQERLSERLVVRAPAAAETFLLAGRPRPGTVAADFLVAEHETIGAVAAYDEAAGRIQVDSRGAAIDSSFRLSYPIRPTLPPGTFAQIVLSLDLSAGAPLGETPRQFNVSFSARAAHWAFYLLTPLTNPLAEFSVVDVSPPASGPGPAFPAANQRDLSADPDPGDAVAIGLAARLPTPGHRLIRFVSAEAMAARQRPGRRIELRVAGNTLFPALPNPQPSSFGTLSLGVPPDAQNSDILFAVVSQASP